MGDTAFHQSSPTFTASIKRLRESRGWSLRDLERQTGITNGHLSHMENGRSTNISLTNAIRIARAFGVTVDHMSQDGPLCDVNPMIGHFSDMAEEEAGK